MAGLAGHRAVDYLPSACASSAFPDDFQNRLAITFELGRADPRNPNPSSEPGSCRAISCSVASWNTVYAGTPCSFATPLRHSRNAWKTSIDSPASASRDGAEDRSPRFGLRCRGELLRWLAQLESPAATQHLAGMPASASGCSTGRNPPAAAAARRAAGTRCAIASHRVPCRCRRC